MGMAEWRYWLSERLSCGDGERKTPLTLQSATSRCHQCFVRLGVGGAFSWLSLIVDLGCRQAIGLTDLLNKDSTCGRVGHAQCPSPTAILQLAASGESPVVLHLDSEKVKVTRVWVVRSPCLFDINLMPVSSLVLSIKSENRARQLQAYGLESENKLTVLEFILWRIALVSSDEQASGSDAQRKGTADANAIANMSVFVLSERRKLIAPAHETVRLQQ